MQSVLSQPDDVFPDLGVSVAVSVNCTKVEVIRLGVQTLLLKQSQRVVLIPLRLRRSNKVWKLGC